MTTDTIPTKLHEPVRETPFLIRAIWFFVLGWELTGVWILIAWALNASILGLPLGLWMIDRVPQVLTLKARSGSYLVDVENGRSQFIPGKQVPFLVRALYFVVIGWWFSLLWAAIAWLLCATIIGLPLGVMMLNGLPAVTTLGHS
ncbi:MAG: YccF domain-containing protein [Anaerolineales bacterium]|nr:YccF domain-containing protein [Anaerolineales bacterium]MCA9928959.1 YccF domain-containing protein [Anaerolineales bacterium]